MSHYQVYSSVQKRPCTPPLTRVNMGAAFPVIFAFSPVSQSAGRHETRARALDGAQNGLGHMAQRCPLCDCNCAEPPLEASKSLMVPISMPPNDLQWHLVGLEEGDFACAVA